MDNPAYERLLQDYVHYHLALVVVGGFFTLALLVFAVFSWLHVRRAPKGVERRTHLAFAVASSVRAATAELTRSLARWIRSGNADVPPVIQEAVDARLAWQEPKAVITTVLLLAFVAVSVAVWRSVFSRARAGRRVTGRVLLGSASAFACFLLILMVMGNTQASYAPITMTLLFG